MHIPITRPYITDREVELVGESLQSGWLVQGPRVEEFEEKISLYTGAKYAVAVNSCTSGQMILSRILGLHPGQEVVLPAFTWISTAHAVEFTGAKPVLADISLDTFNIDTGEMSTHIGPATRALCPVSLFGRTADMPKIMETARLNNLEVVEDVACGLGSFLHGQHCGTFGNAGVLSFHPRKSITTGEGGVIITNDKKIYEMARSLREHGATKSDYQRHKGSAPHQMSAYPHLGFNMRMTDMQAAVGLAQHEKLSEILEKRRQLAQEYTDRLSGLRWLKTPTIPEGHNHSFQTYCTLFKPQETTDAVGKKDQRRLDELHQERNQVMENLASLGIMTRPGTHALHIQEYYQKKYGYNKMDFPAAYAADRLTIALPLYPTMKKEEKDYLLDQLTKLNV